MLGPTARAHEWPDGPNKHYLENLQRPDNAKSPERWSDPKSLMCCGVADTVKTRFRIEPAGGRHPEDRWYAWLKEEWTSPAGENRPRFCARRPALPLSARGHHSVLRAAERRPVMMRATLIIAALSALTALPAAAGGEWPDGPNKQWFKGLQRPDNHKFPDRDAKLHDVLRSR